ncbi:MAG: hypothetical protein GC183_12180 [Thiobacillus sp.]|nr:hypothetical protein [Thiobacillus sp.]
MPDEVLPQKRSHAKIDRPLQLAAQAEFEKVARELLFSRPTQPVQPPPRQSAEQFGLVRVPKISLATRVIAIFPVIIITPVPFRGSVWRAGKCLQTMRLMTLPERLPVASGLLAH